MCAFSFSFGIFYFNFLAFLLMIYVIAMIVTLTLFFIYIPFKRCQNRLDSGYTQTFRNFKVDVKRNAEKRMKKFGSDFEKNNNIFFN